MAGITFVKSPTYGDHVRAARGTYKKAKPNAAFKKQSKKLVKADLPAQIFRNAINPYRQDFYYGQLWQDLVSVTNGAMQKGRTFDFSRLKPFEINPKYPLGRLIDTQSTMTVDKDSSKLQVTLSSDTPYLNFIIYCRSPKEKNTSMYGNSDCCAKTVK